MTAEDTRVGARSSWLIEREHELAVIDAVIADTVAGQSAIVMIDGAAGIGKSALLSAMIAEGRRVGLRIATARCSEFERDGAFGAIRQLFEPLLADKGTSELLVGSARLAAPVFDDGEFGASLAPVVPDGVLHGLYWLATNAAAVQPMLIAVDDVQCCDAPSLRWLAYLARRVDGLPITLALSMRSGEPDTDLPLIAEMTGNGLCRTLHPAPLSEAGVADLVAQTLPGVQGAVARGACRPCRDATGGNPLLLRELLRVLTADGAQLVPSRVNHIPKFGPRSVARSVLRRVSRHSPCAIEVARTIAILADEASIDVIAAACGASEQGVTATVDALVAMGILHATGAIGFVHPIVRAAIEQDMPSDERGVRHRRAAELLAFDKQPPEKAALHLLASRPAAELWAVDVLRDAAREAMRRGAPDVAARYLTRALAEPPPGDDLPELLAELGVAELQSCDRRAVSHLEQALAQTSDVRRRAEVARFLASALTVCGRVPEGVHVLDRARAELGSHAPDQSMRLEGESLFWAVMTPEIAASALPRIQEFALHLGRVSPPDPPSRYGPLAVLAGYYAWAGTSRGDAVDFARRALAGDASQWPPAAPLAIATLQAADELDLAQRCLDDAVDHSLRTGSVLDYAKWKCLRSYVFHRRGDIGAAADDVLAAVGALESEPDQPSQLFRFAPLGTVLLETGQPDEAYAALKAADLLGDVPPGTQTDLVLHCRGRLRASRGDLHGGLTDLLEAGRRSVAAGVCNPAWTSWRSDAALVYRALGQHVEARDLAREELAGSRLWGAPRATGVALRVAGIVEGGHAGLGLLEESVAVLEASNATLELARALTDLGIAHAGAGRHGDSRGFLRRGLGLAQRCSAPVLAARAARALVAAGGRPRRERHAGVAALTPAERRTSRLAADGRTNREIGETLFVSLRTVEIHLTSVYRKLAVTGRGQLAAALQTSSPTRAASGAPD